MASPARVPAKSPEPAPPPRLPDLAVRAMRALAAGVQGEPDARHAHEWLVRTVMQSIVALVLEHRGFLDDSTDARAGGARGLDDRCDAPAGTGGHPAASLGNPGAWAQLQSLFRSLHGGGRTRGTFGSFPFPGGLFAASSAADAVDREGASSSALTAPGLLCIADAAVVEAQRCLRGTDGVRALFSDLEIEQVGAAYEALLGWELIRSPSTALLLRQGNCLLDLDELSRLPATARVDRLRALLKNGVPQRCASAVGCATSATELAAALARYASRTAPCPMPAGTWVLCASGRRRTTGSHYTSRAMAREVVRGALQPLLAEASSGGDPERILALRICDPAMGTGAFLLEAGRQLVEALGFPSHPATQAVPCPGDDALRRAWRSVVQRCLFGVDSDPLAVLIARACLTIEATQPGRPFVDPSESLRCGDSLVGLPRAEVEAVFLGLPASSQSAPSRDTTPRNDDPKRTDRRGTPSPISARTCAPGALGSTSPEENLRVVADGLVAAFFSGKTGAERQRNRVHVVAQAAVRLSSGVWDERSRGWISAMREASGLRPFHWELEFPGVFQEPAPGFDAMVGNPPWVAFAGRAAQPLEPSRFDYYRTRYNGFRKYRTLHGLFVERCSGLLRSGGRLGLIVPTSVADLDGYEPVRAAHDRLCATDETLPDFGADGFDGVFQPAMALLSSRRTCAIEVRAGGSPTWSLARDDLDETGVRLLARLSSLPPLPAEMFAERGYQSLGRDDTANFVRTAERAGAPLVPIREGAEIGPFVALAPRLSVDPSTLSGRFRPPEQWRAVEVLIRQTARYPIAAWGDGIAFRNSLLAGFGRPPYSGFSLLALLNCWPVRWLHYARFRDARQGMPQVKIAHLRAIPALPSDSQPRALSKLHRIGRSLGERNRGLSPPEQRMVDDIVIEAWGLTADEAQMIASWAVRNPVPASASSRSDLQG